MASSGIEIYAAFIEAELKSENDRRESVHSRAATLVTSSAGLVTLALGVFGLLVGKHQNFPDLAKPFFVAGVVGLLLGGACAVAALFPLDQRYVDDSTLGDMVVSRRADSEAFARGAVAYINAMGLVSLRRGTTIKALLLFASGVGQILAMLAIGICVWLVVLAQ
jgi:hypothetical protein